MCASRVWALQLLSWMIIVFVSKIILAIALFLLSAPVSDFGCWVMSPVASKPRLELVLVMVVGPYILNAAQFWVRPPPSLPAPLPCPRQPQACTHPMPMLTTRDCTAAASTRFWTTS